MFNSLPDAPMLSWALQRGGLVYVVHQWPAALALLGTTVSAWAWWRRDPGNRPPITWALLGLPAVATVVAMALAHPAAVQLFWAPLSLDIVLALLAAVLAGGARGRRRVALVGWFVGQVGLLHAPFLLQHHGAPILRLEGPGRVHVGVTREVRSTLKAGPSWYPRAATPAQVTPDAPGTIYTWLQVGAPLVTAALRVRLRAGNPTPDAEMPIKPGHTWRFERVGAPGSLEISVGPVEHWYGLETMTLTAVRDLGGQTRTDTIRVSAWEGQNQDLEGAPVMITDAARPGQPPACRFSFLEDRCTCAPAGTLDGDAQQLAGPISCMGRTQPSGIDPAPASLMNLSGLIDDPGDAYLMELVSSGPSDAVPTAPAQ